MTPRPIAMLVDDDALVRSMLGRTLSRAGYAVLEAEDGTSALDASARLGQPIDLLVTDVVMPGMTGWELAEHLRREQPGVKVLVMSGGDTEPSRASGPGTDFLRKPFEPSTLIEHARRLLGPG